jgi:hypothetical protein
MNWLQKICHDYYELSDLPADYRATSDNVSLPATYLDLGHGADQKTAPEGTIVWYYSKKAGYIVEIPEWHGNKPPHIETLAGGRIDTNSGIGTVVFHSLNPHEQKRVIETLLIQYPGIRFAVTGVGAKTVGLQEYWENMFGG